MGTETKSQHEIIEKLNEEFANKACAACGVSASHCVLPGYSKLEVIYPDDPLNKHSLPAVVVICSGCGNIRLHALESLGLMSMHRDACNLPGK